MYEEMGAHLGNAIKTILYALDVELIILGGSVRHAYPFFQKHYGNRFKVLPFKMQ
jgi:glucokinase